MIMKLAFKWLGITTAILVSLESISVKASTPQIKTDLPSANLLAQMRRIPGQYLNNSGVSRVPILARSGGTPIIAVTLDGRKTFPMLVDTGATYTMITPEMARAIGFQPQGKQKIRVASGEVLEVPKGTIDSIQVGEAQTNNATILVGSVPLLGQNFLSAHNVIMAQNFIVFRPKLRR
jgi:predicted aspartyl protease